MANKQRSESPRRQQSERREASEETRPQDENDSSEQIRARAHELYVERGDQAGDAVGDWLRAEQEHRSGSGSETGDGSDENSSQR